MGAIIDLYEGKYLYELPNIPSDEKDILGYDLKKADQYWRPTIFPERFTWKRMTKREQYEIVAQERERYANGLWFFNKGEPTWITGMHYDHMVNATFDFGKAVYYESHRNDFYFRDYFTKDKRCYGQCAIKPRRYGYSMQEITHQTVANMDDFSRMTGMMSNNKDKTDESLFDPLVASYLARPKWVRPDIYMPNNRIPKQELWWNNGVVEIDEEYFKYESTNSLNSRLIPKPTTVMGYDGLKIHYLTLDEAWKWTLADPYECWKKQRPCLNVGGEIIGKCSVLSTMGDDDNYEKAVDSGIQMFLDSDTTVRDENGHTKTGLYQYFVSGVYALFKYSDIYGKINTDAAENEIRISRKKYPEGSTDWTYEVRRYPLTKEEALSSSTGLGIFNAQRIDARIEILNRTIKPTKLGTLDEGAKGRIEWTPTNNGIWEFSKLPLITSKVNYSNRWYEDKVEGQLYLQDNKQGVIGYDAIRYADMDTKSQVLSNAAIVAFQKFDYYGNSGANQFTGLYHARPDDPEEPHYEALKAAKFLGFPIAVERQMEAMKRRSIEYCAINFLLRSHYDGKIGFWTQTTATKDAVDLLTGFWKTPKTTNEIDHLMRCDFIKILKEAKKFNPKKTTIFDIMMAVLQVMLGSLQIKEVVASDTQEKDIQAILDIIQPRRNDTWNNYQEMNYSDSGDRMEQD